MSDISFARPWVLVALALVPIVLIAWAWGMRRGAAQAKAISRTGTPRPPYVSALLLAVAVSLAIVAAALPRWGTTQSYVPRNGADLIVVLDVSRSMDSPDVAPSRLAAAKTALAQTFGRLGGDRVGLVVFAGTSRLRFPLTTDLAAANQVIAGLDTGSIIVEGGTNASLGLDIALDAFDGEANAGRAILLITDGDDLGSDPAGTAARVKESGIDLLVAGIGTPAGGPVPVLDPRTQKQSNKLDANGQPIVTKLNEPFLRALAVAAGGRYIGSDSRQIAGVVAGRLQALKSTRIDQRPTTIPIERYQWFAGAALAALILATLAEWLGRRTGRMALAGAALLPVLLLGGCATAAYTANDDGRRALEAGDTALAIEKFIEAQAGQPDDPRISLNLAAAYHAAERYDEATLAARRVTASPASQDRAKAFASIGHHEFAAGRLPEALDAFRRSLFEDPNDDVTRRDYEVVRRLLNPDEEPPPEEPPPPGETPTQQPGDGGEGETATPPGGGQGQGGTPTPAAGGSATPPPGATPQPGDGASQGSPQDVERQIRQLNAQIARLVEEAGDNPTAAQAVEILRLLAELQRIAGLRDTNDSSNPRDY